MLNRSNIVFIKRSNKVLKKEKPRNSVAHVQLCQYYGNTGSCSFSEILHKGKILVPPKKKTHCKKWEHENIHLSPIHIKSLSNRLLLIKALCPLSLESLFFMILCFIFTKKELCFYVRL